MSELLPCPFCGGEAKVIEMMEGGFSAQCTNCLTIQGVRSYERTVEKWNTRAYCEAEAVEEKAREFIAAAGYVKERTCYDKNKSAREHGATLFMWRCSNCDESYDTEMDRLNYCPNCGARVLGADE